MSRTLAALLSLPVAFACSGDPVETPVTVFDAGSILPDAGPTRDGGLARDGGARDGGRSDGGAPRDGGIDGGDDAGERDAGPRDGGAPDATPPSWTRMPIDDTFLEAVQVDLVDLDRDTDLDAVVSLLGTETVRAYLNGGGQWTSIDVAPLGSIVASGHAFADFDDDGRTDIVAIGLYAVGAPWQSPSRIAWYGQPAIATDAWTENVVLTAGIYGLNALAVGDLTGDGLPDLVVGAVPTNDENGMPTGDGLFWLRNDDGVFSAPIIIDNTLSAVEQIEVRDVDGDGVDDVVASGRGSNVLAWYESSRAAGTVVAEPVMNRHDIATIVESNGFAFGQLDADPALEIVVAHDDGATGAVVLLDPPADPRDPWTSQTLDDTLGGPTFPTAVAIGDFQDDGENDVVVASKGTLRTYTRLLGVGWSPVTLTALLTGLIDVDTGDIDGDGFDDLITVTRGNAPNRDELTWWQTQP